MTTKAAAWLFALIVVGMLVMPARYLFVLVGVTLVGGGIYVLPGSVLKGTLAIVVGVLFVGLGMWTVLREQRGAARDTRRAQEDAAAMARRNRRTDE